MTFGDSNQVSDRTVSWWGLNCSLITNGIGGPQLEWYGPFSCGIGGPFAVAATGLTGWNRGGLWPSLRKPTFPISLGSVWDGSALGCLLGGAPPQVAIPPPGGEICCLFVVSALSLRLCVVSAPSLRFFCSTASTLEFRTIQAPGLALPSRVPYGGPMQDISALAASYSQTAHIRYSLPQGSVYMFLKLMWY